MVVSNQAMRHSFKLISLALILLSCSKLDKADAIPMYEETSQRIDRNLQKDSQELLEDIQAILASGTVKFEVYNTSGDLLTVLSQTEDITPSFQECFNACTMEIKSVAQLGTLTQKPFAKPQF